MKPQTVIQALIVGTLFALAGTALSADAADFTFHVPVRLSSMPADRTTVNVTCEVSDGTHSLGRRAVDINISGTGNYTGTVRVEIDAPTGREHEVNRYRCWIYPYANRAGTTPIYSVSGDIR